jgi:outer membrane protein assembly factor BamB
VDTPPTIHHGLALFGANDGWVYAVRASDGRLAWRLRAAPRDRLVGAHNQLESAWPVPGAVLIHDDLAWVAAGRSSYLDGGIRVLAIEPATGKLVREIVLDSQTNPSEPGDDLGRGNLGDILSSDGAGVCLRHERVFQDGEPTLFRVLASSSYTDASWFNRNEWIAGKARTSGLMVMDGDSAYGTEVYKSISREDVFSVGQQAYRLTAFRIDGDPAKNQQNLAQKSKSRMGAKKAPQRWQIRPPIRITAMTAAADTLFIAGPPDTVDPKKPLAAFDGQAGGILWALSTADGARLAEYRLDAPPVWDGLIAAGGRLYLAAADGHVLCYE